MYFHKLLTCISIVSAAFVLFVSCNKSPADPDSPGTAVIETPNEVPDLPFGAWIPKTAVIPASYEDVSASAGLKAVDITINFSKRISRVSSFVYGNNANCYTGWMQDNGALMKNISNLKMGVMRIPGGSISDVYFWNRKGVYENYAIKSYDPPLTDVPSSISPWAGKRVQSFEEWSMGVDQYYQMMQLTQSTGLVTVNYGYARYGTGNNPVAQAAHLAADWVRYDNGRSKFWEIGNEVSGSWEAGYEIDQALNKDGQPKRITGDLYGRHALVFMDSMRAAARQTGKEICIGVVCDQETNTAMPTWNREVIAHVGDKTDFYIIHSYFTPYQGNSAPDVILNSPAKIAGYKAFLQNELTMQGKPSKPVFLTEWNIFAEGSQQMVSYVNGMHAALILGESIKNGLVAAARWDLANGYNNGNDHGLFSTGDDPGVEKYAPRPSFYYLYFFQKYFGDILVDASTNSSNVGVYASQFTSGEAGIILVNKNSFEQAIQLNLRNFLPGSRYYYHVLTGGSDNGNFSRKVYVNGISTAAIAGGPENYESIRPKSSAFKGAIQLSLPKYSVICLLVDNKQN